MEGRIESWVCLDGSLRRSSSWQNDKYLEAMEYEIPFPSPLDDRKAEDIIKRIEKWEKEGWRLVRKAGPREASGRKHFEIPPAVAAIRPHVEAKVSRRAGELISGRDEAWEQAAREYVPMMAAVAKSLSPGYTVAALQRRRQIANVRPDMRLKTAAAEKTGRNKGEGK